jgi:hypothetical protein
VAGTTGTSADRLRPGQIESRRRRLLTRYLRREVGPYSPLHRRRFDAAGLTPSAVADVGDLARLPPVALTEIDDPADLVLRPTEASIRAGGDFELRWRLAWSKLTSRPSWFNEHVIDPRYKPVHWTVADGVLIGWSADDLERLGDLGRRWLAVAGVRRRDALVTVLPMTPTLGFWQLALGARAAGLSTVHAGRTPDPDLLQRMGPTVLAGGRDDLLALDGWGGLDRLRLVLVVDGVLDADTRAELVECAGGRASVVAAWAPPGVRAMWAECRGGTGFHTWPETEVIQRGDDDELVWSPIGWRGSVLLRMRTGAAADIDDRPCPSCGRTGPRVHPRVAVSR